MELAEFRAALDDWLDADDAALVPDHDGLGTLDEHR